MGFNLASFPQIVIKQATAPTAAAGALWWDTDDLLLYYYSGSSWIQISSASDAAGYESMVAQIMLEVLRLSAEGVLTAPDYDSLFCDFFADADGQDGTLNTGQTTAAFSTDSYINGLASANYAHGHAMASTESANTTKSGMKIACGTSAVSVVSITKKSTCNATKGYILDASKSVLATTDFTGNVATFSTPYLLTASTTYYFTADLNGSTLTSYYGGGVSYPIAGTYFNWTGGQDTAGGDNANTAFNIESANIEITPANKIIQTNAQALSFAPAFILVHVKDKTIAGTGTITFDASFDGGSTWDSTGNALDTKIAVVDGSAKSMEIKLNLNGTGSENTATAKDYGVILWSS